MSGKKFPLNAAVLSAAGLLSIALIVDRLASMDRADEPDTSLEVAPPNPYGSLATTEAKRKERSEATERR